MSSHDQEGTFPPRSPTPRHRAVRRHRSQRSAEAGKPAPGDFVAPLTNLLDLAADSCRRGTLSADACELILAWWIWPQLTACDFIELGVSRPRVREAIDFLRGVPVPMRVLLAGVMPAAAETNRSGNI